VRNAQAINPAADVARRKQRGDHLTGRGVQRVAARDAHDHISTDCGGEWGHDRPRRDRPRHGASIAANRRASSADHCPQFGREYDDQSVVLGTRGANGAA